MFSYPPAIDAFYKVDNIIAVLSGCNSAGGPAASVSATQATADLLTRMRTLVRKDMTTVHHLVVYRKATLARRGDWSVHSLFSRS